MNMQTVKKQFTDIYLWAAVLALSAGLMAIRAEAGTWYRGDLHAHSQYSDGDSPVSAVIARAENAGLDFFVITDHDSSLGGVPALWQDPAYTSEGMLLLYGIEWTTCFGHANLWAAAPFDYEEIWQARQQLDPVAAANAAHAAGALFSINHPSGYLCCPWEYEVPDGIDAVEVWNDMYCLPMFNHWAGHRFWDGLLSAGRRIPGVGGSDMHQLSGWQSWLFGIGNPTTWVYADELSAQSILAGLQAGHVTISYAPQAPRLEFSADIDGDGNFEAMAGDAASCGPGQTITFKVQVTNRQAPEALACRPAYELDQPLVEALASGTAGIDDVFSAGEACSQGSAAQAYALGVFKNGRLLRAALIFSEDYTFIDAPDAQAYYRVELIGRPEVGLLSGLLYGRMIALSNPIYVACGD